MLNKCHPFIIHLFNVNWNGSLYKFNASFNPITQISIIDDLSMHLSIFIYVNGDIFLILIKCNLITNSVIIWKWYFTEWNGTQKSVLYNLIIGLYVFIFVWGWQNVTGYFTEYSLSKQILHSNSWLKRFSIPFGSVSLFVLTFSFLIKHILLLLSFESTPLNVYKYIVHSQTRKKIYPKTGWPYITSLCLIIYVINPNNKSKRITIS